MTVVLVVIVLDAVLATVAFWKLYEYFKNFKDERPDLD